ncbi:hypothetical protein RCL1_006973 [Eukaryota sp. TZLM3-RCL]
MSCQTSCQCSQLECRLSQLEDAVSDQKNLSVTLNDKLNDNSSATYTHISTLNDRIHSLEALVLKQSAEMSHLRTQYDAAHAKIQQLESKLSQTSLLSSDQSNLIDQFKELLPFVSQLQVAQQQSLAELKQNEFKSNPISFICKYPSEIYGRFGNRTKFIGQTKGSCLELSNDDSLVRSTEECSENSFVAINHPLNGRITLTFRSTNSDGFFDSCIGYFNPNKCQDRDFYNHFIGIYPYDEGPYFWTNGSYEKVSSKLSPSQSIVISFENNKVTYATPHSGWSRTVDCVDGWVFGIQIFYEGESWAIE